MENNSCLECGGNFVARKTLGRHIRDVHKMMYVDYLARHGKSEKLICGCGNEFENTRYPGGPRSHGRRQIHCSAKCASKATNVRAYGLTLKDYYDLLKKQNGLCAICFEPPGDGDRKLAVDHMHVFGYFELCLEERKKYVRGLLCILCNKHRMAEMNINLAKNMLTYLQDFDSRFQ
jgi:hypothetical protein